MRVMLVQHGEAVSKDTDPDRPLSSKGRSDIEALGKLLSSTGVTTGMVWHSGKTRARETAEILDRALGSGSKVRTMAGLNPDDSVEPIAAWLADSNQDLLLVGHLPFMARLVGHLVSGRVDPPIVAYQPGTIVCLERADQGSWSVAWMIRPHLLS